MYKILSVLFLLLIPTFTFANEQWKSDLEEKIAKEAEFDDVIIIMPIGRYTGNGIAYLSHSYSDDPTKLSIKIKQQDGSTEEFYAKYLEAIKIPAALEPIKKGDAFEAHNMHFIKFPKQRDNGIVIKDIKQLDGLIARKNILANKPLLASDFIKPSIITKGKTIKMMYIKDSLSIETTGIALESGSLDDYIKVRNSDGNKVINAKVINEGAVLVN